MFYAFNSYANSMLFSIGMKYKFGVIAIIIIITHNNNNYYYIVSLKVLFMPFYLFV